MKMIISFCIYLNLSTAIIDILYIDIINVLLIKEIEVGSLQYIMISLTINII